jgi:hypothetical protein
MPLACSTIYEVCREIYFSGARIGMCGDDTWRTNENPTRPNYSMQERMEEKTLRSIQVGDHEGKTKSEG